jgi:glucose-1-phosphate thymidylyltransferase
LTGERNPTNERTHSRGRYRLPAPPDHPYGSETACSCGEQANHPVRHRRPQDANITDIGIVLGEKCRDDIQAFLGDGSEFGVDITYIIQDEPLGLAHVVGCAEGFVGDDDFVVYLGDNILKQGIGAFTEGFRDGNYAAGIALQHVDNPEQFGIATVGEDGTVFELTEKPNDPESNLALIGIYVFSPAIFEAINELESSWRGELEITDAIQWLLDHNNSIDSHIVEGWWKDTGKPEDILEANRLVLEEYPGGRNGTIEPDADVREHIDLHPDATIEAGAVAMVRLVSALTRRSKQERRPLHLDRLELYGRECSHRKQRSHQ